MARLDWKLESSTSVKCQVGIRVPNITRTLSLIPLPSPPLVKIKWRLERPNWSCPSTPPSPPPPTGCDGRRRYASSLPSLRGSPPLSCSADSRGGGAATTSQTLPRGPRVSEGYPRWFSPCTVAWWFSP